MGTEHIFGDWDHKPTIGEHDEFSALWHLLAAQNVGTGDFIPNFGLSQRRCEIVQLWQLYKRAKPKVVVEIGVAQGGTFASWCILATSGTKLIGIDRDLNDARPRPGEPVSPLLYNGPLSMSCNGGGIYSMARPGISVHGISGWSSELQTLSQLREILEGRKIDFLFHDASHAAEMFRKDFEIYWPMISDGGIFASHDISPSADPKCDKNREWERIKREEEYSALFEFLPHHSVTEMGIGVLIK